MPPHKVIPRDKLLKFVEYDPETGQFKAKIANRRTKAGHVFTARYLNTYIHIRVDGESFNAARAAWVYMTGKQPAFIDHVNGWKHDNRWSNLRNVSQSENSLNTRKHRTARGEQEDFYD